MRMFTPLVLQSNVANPPQGADQGQVAPGQAEHVHQRADPDRAGGRGGGAGATAAGGSTRWDHGGAPSQAPPPAVPPGPHAHPPHPPARPGALSETEEAAETTKVRGYGELVYHYLTIHLILCGMSNSQETDKL